jgi:NitT/TauT family transport system ATP-binding protein
MDEPLKGLDIALKLTLIRIFSRMWQADRRTVIFVTHDVDEALLLGRDIIVLSRPPAQIKLNKQVDLPVEKRSLESEYFRALKQSLLTALGN